MIKNEYLFHMDMANNRIPTNINKSLKGIAKTPQQLEAVIAAEITEGNRWRRTAFYSEEIADMAQFIEGYHATADWHHEEAARYQRELNALKEDSVLSCGFPELSINLLLTP
tara:strand:+ start:833 stop:1168 length:336 start_codon:yes stop_codon:yes gene_type:complete